MDTSEWKWNTNDSLEMYSNARVPPEKAKGVVCLVHGVGEHIGRYQADGEALAEGGYILAGFDQRGFGKSGSLFGLKLVASKRRCLVPPTSPRHPRQGASQECCATGTP